MHNESVNPGTVVKIMGAYISWVMGSGFATGQEILQFFTSYGYYSFLMIGINLIGFLIVGPAILEAGYSHREDRNFLQTRYFCGKRLGIVYAWLIGISLFAGMVVLISGAGATLHEYYGIHHFIGAAVLAGAAFLAYVVGFQRFVKAVSFIGPLIIAFTIFVGLVTCLRDFDGLSSVNQYSEMMRPHRSTKFWWLSALLYISYNLTGGSMYYTAVGATAASRKEAVYGAAIGSVVLMLAILLMNTAMLSNIGEVGNLAIPTLALARKISYLLGAAFSITLVFGIFSTCSAMLWTVTERFTTQGSRKAIAFAAVISIIAFLLGLLPFTDLISVLYPYLGYADLGYVACVIYHQILVKRKNGKEFIRN